MQEVVHDLFIWLAKFVGIYSVLLIVVYAAWWRIRSNRDEPKKTLTDS